jgi:uncharacterized membrane protein YcaP (DUF421 family)
MNIVLRTFIVYIFLVIIIRLAGKKSLAESSTFDFVLLLIISEVTQQALVGEDFSLTASFIAISTLVGIDMLFVLLKYKWKLFGKIAESTPLLVVNKGVPLWKRMKLTQVEIEDILEAARLAHGIYSIDKIEYAVLEKDGSISIIPKEEKNDTKPA